MRLSIPSLIAVAAVAACGSSTNPNTLLAHGIISGQNQTVVAGADKLGNAVIEAMVRNSTGTLSLHRVEPRSERLLDLLVPRAYAQGTGTVVNGSPVPGAVVCAAGGDGGLVPFAQCTNTDSAGHATFFFTPSNQAGVHTSQIRGTVNNEPAVFDTAKATVNAAAVDPNFRRGPFPIGPSPYVLPDTAATDAFGNGVPYRVLSDSLLTAGDTVLGSIGARTVTWAAPQGSSKNNRIATILGTNGAVIGHFRYTLATDGTLVPAYSAGVNLTP